MPTGGVGGGEAVPVSHPQGQLFAQLHPGASAETENHFGRHAAEAAGGIGAAGIGAQAVGARLVGAGADKTTLPSITRMTSRALSKGVERPPALRTLGEHSAHVATHEIDPLKR